MFPNPSFNGKTVLITGAASGIGSACAHRLVLAGAGGLVLVDKDSAALSALVDSLTRSDRKLLPIVQDVADPIDWEETQSRITAQFGHVDYVIANAGVAAAAPIADMTFEMWRRVMAVNLDGVFLTLQAGFRLIRAGGRGGAMVVTGSASGVKAEPGVGAYGASKAGAMHLARIAAREGAPDNIRVNTVLPGGVETPMWRDVPMFRDLTEKAGGDEAAAFAELGKMATPLGRYAKPEEIADLILFLLSDACAVVTGAQLGCDGGYAA